MKTGGTLRKAAVAGLAAGLVVTAWAPSAGAQYFGGNKVRYENPDFHVLATEHFDVYHYDEEQAGAATAAVLVERWNARLADVLDHNLSGRQPLILYAGHPHFRQTNATPGEIGEGTGGFTEMFKRRIVLPFSGPLREADHVLGHELVHAFQFDMTTEVTPQGQSRGSTALRLPLWFIEGMAEYLSLGSTDPHTAMWMRDAVLQDDLPAISRLGRSRYFPYRYGHAFWAYVAGRFGDAAVPRLLRAAGKVGDVGRAIKTELQVDHKQLSADWHAALRQEFGPQIAAAHAASDQGRALVVAERGRGELNVSPSLSPDGRRLLFYSERGRYSIELYLLDVESGEVVRRLTRTATDPHLESLQFLYSAGTWSPDGRRIAIGSVSRGRPALTILDAETGDTAAEHRFADLVEVLHPAWSPDGRRIAFAANAGGFLQLYLFDLETGERRPLTGAPYAAMQPAWSPDGRRLAFVTDRFTSDHARLAYGDFRLASLDVATGAIAALPSLEGGKNINPQWSRDGRHLYFLSDARGATNLHRLDVARGTIEQMSDLKTGISGLARVSPALSVAAQSERIAASVFERGMYHIYLLDAGRGRAVAAARDPAAPRPGALPPRERAEPKVDRLLASAMLAPEAVPTGSVEPYRARMAVDRAAQPNVAVGVSSAGTFGGGLALYWSDMLGDHNLVTLLQTEGTDETVGRNTAAVVSYENRERRWGWGAAAGQIPYRSLAFAIDFGTYNGEPAQRNRLIREWQINREVAARAAYPFTRADRVEVSAAYRHISYITDSYDQIYSLNDGRLLAEGTVDLPSPDSLSLWPAGVAFVHDSSVFGGTAPAVGQRYRIEAGGVFGDITYFAPLVDYRHYVAPFPYLTLAGRVLHFGRYGSQAEDPRLSLLSVGSLTLVRGYTLDSFDIAECDPAALPACPVVDQLFGSRLAVGGVEARVPVFGGRALVHTPAVPPIDVAAFYDTGVAWTRAEEARFLGGPREAVSSYGGSLRMNLFGVLVLQWNYVKPIDRPLKDWHWEFFFAAGF
jgi:Tol biopolymer transport system component